MLSYNKREVRKALVEVNRNIRVAGTELDQTIEDVIKNTNNIFSEFEHQVQLQINENKNDINDSGRFFIEESNNLKRLYKNQIGGLDRIDDLIGMYYDEDYSNESATQALEKFQNVFEFFKNLYDPSENLVWLTRTRGNVEAYSCPKDIDKKAGELFFSGNQTTVLTSATLTNQKNGTDEEKYAYFTQLSHLGNRNAP